MARILYVEDDLNLSYVTKDSLELAHHSVCHCTDGKEAINKIEAENFDICILDIMLPKADGFEIAESIRRKNNNLPIIFLSAKSLQEDRIKGLKLGADDYITKPFSIEELLLKIDVFLRRSKIETSDKKLESIYHFNDLYFDHKNLLIDIKGKKQSLTNKEGDLLNLFCNHPGDLLKREDILTQIWGDDDYFMGRSLDVFISKLRNYIKEENSIEIENIHGVGFRLKLKE